MELGKDATISLIAISDFGAVVSVETLTVVADSTVLGRVAYLPPHQTPQREYFVWVQSLSMVMIAFYAALAAADNVEPGAELFLAVTAWLWDLVDALGELLFELGTDVDWFIDALAVQIELDVFW